VGYIAAALHESYEHYLKLGGCTMNMTQQSHMMHKSNPLAQLNEYTRQSAALAEDEGNGDTTFDFEQLLNHKEALLYQLRMNLAGLLEDHAIYDHPFNDNTLDAGEVYANVWALQAALLETPDEYAMCWTETWLMCAVIHSYREVMLMPMPRLEVFLDHQQRLQGQMIETLESLLVVSPDNIANNVTDHVVQPIQ
jgi:hypothetical protein